MTNKKFIEHAKKLCPDPHFSIKIIGPALDNVLVRFTISGQELFPKDIIKQLEYPDLFIKDYIRAVLISLRNKLDIYIGEL